MISNIIQRKIKRGQINQETKYILISTISKINQKYVDKSYITPEICLGLMKRCNQFIEYKKFIQANFTMKLIQSLFQEGHSWDNCYIGLIIKIRIVLMKIKYYQTSKQLNFNIKDKFYERVKSFENKISKNIYYQQIRKDYYSNIQLIYLKLIQFYLSKRQYENVQLYIQIIKKIIKWQLKYLNQLMKYQDKKIFIIIQIKNDILIKVFCLEIIFYYERGQQKINIQQIWSKYLQILQNSLCIISLNKYFQIIQKYKKTKFSTQQKSHENLMIKRQSRQNNINSVKTFVQSSNGVKSNLITIQMIQGQKNIKKLSTNSQVTLIDISRKQIQKKQKSLIKPLSIFNMCSNQKRVSLINRNKFQQIKYLHQINPFYFDETKLKKSHSLTSSPNNLYFGINYKFNIIKKQKSKILLNKIIINKERQNINKQSKLNSYYNQPNLQISSQAMKEQIFKKRKKAIEMMIKISCRYHTFLISYYQINIIDSQTFYIKVYRKAYQIYQKIQISNLITDFKKNCSQKFHNKYSKQNPQFNKNQMLIQQQIIDIIESSNILSNIIAKRSLQKSTDKNFFILEKSNQNVLNQLFVINQSFSRKDKLGQLFFTFKKVNNKQIYRILLNYQEQKNIYPKDIMEICRIFMNWKSYRIPPISKLKKIIQYSINPYKFNCLYRIQKTIKIYKINKQYYQCSIWEYFFNRYIIMVNQRPDNKFYFIFLGDNNKQNIFDKISNKLELYQYDYSWIEHIYGIYYFFILTKNNIIFINLFNGIIRNIKLNNTFRQLIPIEKRQFYKINQNCQIVNIYDKNISTQVSWLTNQVCKQIQSNTKFLNRICNINNKLL